MSARAASFRRKTHLTYALFLALPVGLFIAAYVYPVAYSVVMSFHRWDGMSPNWTWNGLGNYAALMGNREFWAALFNNLRWLAFDLLVPTSAGLCLALLLNDRIGGETFFKTIFFLPFTMTPVAVAAFWKWIYQPDRGVIAQSLDIVGLGFLEQNWLGDPNLVNYSIMFASLWWKAGFSFLVYFAGLRGVPQEYIEAARIDGAKPWSIFWNVTFPLLWPSTIVVLGVSGIDAMRVFDIVQGLTQGGPYGNSHVLATFMYETSFMKFDMGTGAAIAVSLMILAMVVILPYIIYMANRVEDVSE